MQIALHQRLNGWLEAALSFFYPEVCQYCRNERATSDSGFIGPACQEKVTLIVPPYCEICGLPYRGAITTSFICPFCRDAPRYFSTARAVVATRDMMLDLIHRYKRVFQVLKVHNAENGTFLQIS